MLLHPVASPAVVRSSNVVVDGVHEFRQRLGIESGSQSAEARRWGHAAAEARDRVLTTGAVGIDAAGRLGSETFDRTTKAFRSVDVDGDGIPDKPRALGAVEDAGSAIKGAAAGSAGAVGALFRRKRGKSATPDDGDAAPAREDG